MNESPVRSVNRVPLEYWRLRGYTSTDVDRICEKLDNTHAARIQILPGLQFRITISSKVAETEQGHFPAIAKLIKEWLQTFTGDEEEPVGDLFFWMEDGQWTDLWGKQAPVIAYAKPVTDKYTFLMPDPAFLGTNGYASERQEIAEFESTTSWRIKKPSIFWRGVNSGLISLGEEWRKAQRVQLVDACKAINDQTIIDAYFSHVIPIAGTDSEQTLTREGLVKGKVPFSEFMNHRYLVDVDGESSAWRSFFLKLQTKSVVLKVDSPVMQWYYDRLIPWVHYVPIASDMSDLLQIREYLEQNAAKAQLIAENASLLMAEIQVEQQRTDMFWLFNEILNCYRR